jgi:hypothetical protein
MLIRRQNRYTPGGQLLCGSREGQSRGTNQQNKTPLCTKLPITSSEGLRNTYASS